MLVVEEVNWACPFEIYLDFLKLDRDLNHKGPRPSVYSPPWWEDSADSTPGETGAILTLPTTHCANENTHPALSVSAM